MTSVREIPVRQQETEDDALRSFGNGLFASLPRADQRRWAEIYLRGLVELDGRKSIRRMSEEIAGAPVDQCLQQFVNQSPWDWGPVRADLARAVASTMQVRAWVVDEVAFPKSGKNSVGVDRQFSRTAGRSLNCQLGLSLSFADEDASCPINWRLVVPRCWETDDRRGRCRLPEGEVPRPTWQYIVEMADEHRLTWNHAPAPLVVDGRAERCPAEMLAAFEARRLPYLVRVTPGARVWEDAERTATGGGPGPAVEDVAAYAARRGTTSIHVRHPVSGQSMPLRTATMRVRRPSSTPDTTSHARSRYVVPFWTGSQRPSSVWVTNMPSNDPMHLPKLAALSLRTRSDLEALADRGGLHHFEGRSYPGWHHHTTLASGAWGFELVRRAASDEIGEGPPVGLRSSV